MRSPARLLLLASTLAACSPSAVSGFFDGGSDVPVATTDAPVAAADVPVATTDVPVATVDVPVTPVDVPVTPVVDAGNPVVDAGTALDVPTTSAPDSGTIQPRADAGPLPLDGGALGDPAWVPLDVRVNASCPTLMACGGDVLGTWDVGGGCIEFPVPSQLMACPGAMVTRADGQARGRVVYAGGFARRASQWQTEAEVLIPQLCATVIGGCPAIQTFIRGTFPDSSCTAEATGDCRCVARQSGMFNDADAYTTSSTQIISATTGKRWNYCIAGTQMHYQDVSSSGTREPGIIELIRRLP